MSRAELEEALWAILDTLREYLSDLILIGGWVPYLHFRYGDVANPDAAVSLTVEADLIVPARLPAEGRRAVTEILEEAAFNPIGESGVVWGRDIEGGEKIEFFIPHGGPAARATRPVQIGEQPGLRALPLDHLWVLQASTDEIRLASPGGRGQPVQIRVPTMTAFVLNKANTFNLRRGPDGELKSGKDLVYLRDVMAAGEQAQVIVERELGLLLASQDAGRVRAFVDRAGVHLRMVAEKYYRGAVDILVERDGVTPAVAQADVEGHLADLADLLEATSEH